MSDDVLLRRLDAAMLDIYRRARSEADYNATRFLVMVQERGGLATAQHLLRQPPSDGFTQLFEKDRLDLAVESLVQRPEFRSLFSEEELRTAVERVGNRSGGAA
jgi:hypothetical protein